MIRAHVRPILTLSKFVASTTATAITWYPPIVKVLRLNVQRCRRLRLALALAAIPAVARALPQPAGEPDSASLAGARELFLEATDDFDAGRVEDALAKFQRVAAVRETAQVRFNIAKCEASLGRLATALGDFERAEREAPPDAKGNAIAKLSHEQAAVVRRDVPRLTVACNAAVPGVSVSVDAQGVPPASFDVPLPVDPGPHVVEATATGRSPFRRQVQLAPSQSLRVVVELPEAPPPALVTTPLPAPTAAQAAGDQPTEPAEARSSGWRLTSRGWAYIALGTGAALGATALAFTLLERGAASDVTTACPDTSHCSRANETAVESSQSAARRDEALAIGFGAGALVALGIGGYFLLTAPTAHRVHFEPASPGTFAGGSIAGAF